MEISLSCKNFDSWVSFLGRLAKIGNNYILKNDVFIATEKNEMPSTTDKYPGKHVIHDPFAVEFGDKDYVQNGIYKIMDIGIITQQFDNIAKSDPTARKDIRYVRTQKEIRVIMGRADILVAMLVEEPAGIIKETADSVSWFQDLIEPIREMEDGWTPFTTQDLIHIRNNGVYTIEKKFGDSTGSVKIARNPIFCLAGVSRLDTPIALGAEYSLLPSEQSDVACFRIHAMYKCGQSAVVTVDCVHEYLAMMY